MSEVIILGIETSGILCSVAWRQKNRLLLEYNLEVPNNHAIVLPNLVREGLKKLALRTKDIGCIVLTSGPGSFTGLRIGMAYAKGFCYALEAPLIAISNFELLASQVLVNRFPLYTLLDARKGKYYMGVFEKNRQKLSNKLILEGSALLKYIDQKGILIVHEKVNIDDILIKIKMPVFKGRISANILCELGYQKHIEGKQSHLDDIEPLYLQKFAGVA
jgi:tRNA threonylcarbamoyladenosine biosynthesis protein TsaB